METERAMKIAIRTNSLATVMSFVFLVIGVLTIGGGFIVTLQSDLGWLGTSVGLFVCLGSAILRALAEISEKLGAWNLMQYNKTMNDQESP